MTRMTSSVGAVNSKDVARDDDINFLYPLSSWSYHRAWSTHLEIKDEGGEKTAHSQSGSQEQDKGQRPGATEDVEAQQVLAASSLWRSFSQSTSCHGFNKMAPEEPLRVRSIYWSVAVAAMFAFLILNVTQEIIRYFQYPTLTDVQVQVVKELEFPAVTLCNLSPNNISHLTVDQQNYFLTTSILSGMASPIDWSQEPYNSSYYSTPRSEEYERNISINFANSIMGCYLGRQYYYCKRLFTEQLLEDGVCYTWNYNTSDVWKAQLSGSSSNLVLYMWANQDVYSYGPQYSAGFKVYLHSAQEHPTAATTQFFASAGTSTEAVLTTTQYKYLPKPFAAFGNSSCVDTESEDFQNPLEYRDVYTYGHCLQECRVKFILGRCNCTSVSDPPAAVRCSYKQHLLCYLPAVHHFESNATAKDDCECQQPCQFRTFSVQVSTASCPSDVVSELFYRKGLIPNVTTARDNTLELKIYYNNLMLTTISQKAEITTPTLLSNLGGQMGLCLGASFLTIGEVVEFLIYLALALIRRVISLNRIGSRK